jgi:hypothetical protein
LEAVFRSAQNKLIEVDSDGFLLLDSTDLPLDRVAQRTPQPV